VPSYKAKDTSIERISKPPWRASGRLAERP